MFRPGLAGEAVGVDRLSGWVGEADTDADALAGRGLLMPVHGVDFAAVVPLVVSAAMPKTRMRWTGSAVWRSAVRLTQCGGPSPWGLGAGFKGKHEEQPQGTGSAGGALLQRIGHENEEKLDALLEGARVSFERLALEGLTPELSASLEAKGWDRKVAEKIAEEQAQSERDLMDSLDLLPSLRRRLEVLVPVREFIHGMTFFDEQMRDRGMDIDALANDPVVCLQVIRSMPSMNATVDLKVLNHQMKRPWTSNDIFDINTLAVAMPYADVVVADKHYADLLRNRTRLDRRLGTTVFAKLTELTAYLTALPAA